MLPKNVLLPDCAFVRKAVSDFISKVLILFMFDVKLRNVCNSVKSDLFFKENEINLESFK